MIENTKSGILKKKRFVDFFSHDPQKAFYFQEIFDFTELQNILMFKRFYFTKPTGFTWLLPDVFYTQCQG